MGVQLTGPAVLERKRIIWSAFAEAGEIINPVDNFLYPDGEDEAEPVERGTLPEYKYMSGYNYGYLKIDIQFGSVFMNDEWLNYCLLRKKSHLCLRA